ncbi:MAG: malQ [Chitinophagaceae bacterium]|nr:malQ [Chitinophagaceae bacterium]
MDIPRSSGVILHISSLYTPYGIGDFGPAAYAFADFLQQTGIYFWQTLPLNYTDAGRGYSPYSCLSAFAGNPLFISPDQLVKEKLLKPEDLHPGYFEKHFVEFDKVFPYKTELLEKAFLTFQQQDQKPFESFCTQQAYWLDDFSLFVALKKHFNDCWWLEWPAPLRDREAKALEDIAVELRNEIYKEKFLQYVFFRQLDELRAYCKQSNIRFIGDMPFYVSHDSSDVWVHPNYFKLTTDKRPDKVCGVPPDLFSDTGQLWGMPVYEWEELKKDQYSWWVNRIKQTLNMCDYIRLDHFRAFSAFWEVDASESTAVNGKWMKGPGSDFFKIVKEHYDDMPFIAEDLGDIDQPVWNLMDEFHLPGMKILQFAFMEFTPESIHSPHHHVPHGVVYTGTHDNNTVRGWYDNEIDEEKKQRVSVYFDKEITANTASIEFIRMAIASVSQVAIWPVQDMLGLGEEAIMNRPSTLHGNWRWRLHAHDVLTEELSKNITKRLALFNRLVAKEASLRVPHPQP